MSTQAIAAGTVARHRNLLVALFGGFVLTGVAITLTGPILPVFIARWRLNDSQAGLFITLQYGASLGGVWLATLVAHYFGSRTALVSGYLLFAAGLATINSSSLAVALAAAAAVGTGYGMVVPGTNLSVAEIGGSRGASLVSLVNSAWGVGAVSCSPLVLLALRLQLLPELLLGLASFGCLLVLSFLLVEFPEERRAGASGATKSPADAAADSVGLFTTLALAALFFLYVGAESSLGSWVAAYAKRLAGGSGGMSTLAPMFFYGGLVIGRGLAPLLFAQVREYRLVLSALVIVTAATTILAFAANQSMAFASAALDGLGCASVFPIYIAWLSRWYGSKAKRVGGLTFSMGSLGASLVPGLVGFVSTHSGSLRIGLLVPLSCALFMIFLLVLLRRQAA